MSNQTHKPELYQQRKTLLHNYICETYRHVINKLNFFSLNNKLLNVYFNYLKHFSLLSFTFYTYLLF